MKKEKIELLSTLNGDLLGPQMSAYIGALGCFEEKSSSQLKKEFYESNMEYLKQKDIIINSSIGDVVHKKLNSLTSQYESKVKENYSKLFKGTSGKGHGSVLDQSAFCWSIENIPRFSTMFLCSPQYLEHLQQSLRRAKADRGFYTSSLLDQDDKDVIQSINLQRQAFAFYEKMVKNGIPGEDARYILPLNTYTNIQTKGNARELMHLLGMSLSDFNNVPENTKSIVSKMYDKAEKVAPDLLHIYPNSMQVKAWYPALQLFAKETPLIHMSDESVVEYVDCSSMPGIYWDTILENCIKGNEASLSILKHLHFTFSVKFSLAAFHQAIRQRTWDIACESIYNAIINPFFITPPSIVNTEYEIEFEDLSRNMVDIIHILKNNYPIQEVIGCVPHSMYIQTLLHINGWNTLHSIGKRLCSTAQWDIRNTVEKIKEKIIEKMPVLESILGPQCKVYGKCPENKPCDKFGK